MASRALGIIKKEVLKSMLILGISEVLAVFDGTAVITESGDEFSDPAFTNTYISLLLTEPNPKARLKEIFCGLPSVKSPNAKSGAAFYLYMKMSGKVYSQEVVAEIFSTTARDIAQVLEGIAI